MKTSAVLQIFAGALLAGTLAEIPATAFAQISIGINIDVEPPALPVYVQPPCPEPNYLWTPGYWAWDGVSDYYWVPGTWVAAPQPGYLWTPGYWAYGDGGVYVFHGGYWGTQVGFYGGVNYGFGYGGGGFAGGEWRGGVFAYNTAAVNVNTTVIHTTYVNTTVVHNTTIVNNTHTSFNGGPAGIAAKPTAEQQTFARQPHVPATQAQLQHEQVAKQDKSNFASVNHGVPAHAAVPRPAASVSELQHGAVAGRAAEGAKPFTPHPVAKARTEAAPPARAAETGHPAPAAQAARPPETAARTAPPRAVAAPPPRPAPKAAPPPRPKEPPPEHNPKEPAH